MVMNGGQGEPFIFCFDRKISDEEIEQRKQAVYASIEAFRREFDIEVTEISREEIPKDALIFSDNLRDLPEQLEMITFVRKKE